MILEKVKLKSKEINDGEYKVIIKIKKLTVKHEVEILKNINLNIEKNKITALVGSSGCGKSTLLKSINLMLDKELHQEGEILYLENNILEYPKETLRKEIGLVFQSPTPLPFSVYKNLTYGYEYHHKNIDNLDNLVEKMLKKIGLFHEINDFNMEANKLSGGQQQRMCIARTLMVNPKVILLDEPCSALDVKNTLNIENLLKEICHEYTIVIVTHNLSQARRISDNLIYMEEGEIIESGKTQDVFNNPKDERTKKYLQLEKV
ncbi:MULTISPECIES: phosphate ABC transporter ATP-binding protein [Psychrilyobacter]|uniref:phosphate ABC transporter ATP-binding protein n=1 Tax=Psychrilyobacter TaxID=623282 RepID=UPI0018F59AB3|nr:MULTISPECIES: ATP-binding cassette domain-containing protein [Psychrilyobacter]